jgi:hypothetical protein
MKLETWPRTTRAPLASLRRGSKGFACKSIPSIPAAGPKPLSVRLPFAAHRSEHASASASAKIPDTCRHLGSIVTAALSRIGAITPFYNELQPWAPWLGECTIRSTAVATGTVKAAASPANFRRCPVSCRCRSSGSESGAGSALRQRLNPPTLNAKNFCWRARGMADAFVYREYWEGDDDPRKALFRNRDGAGRNCRASECG